MATTTAVVDDRKRCTQRCRIAPRLGCLFGDRVAGDVAIFSSSGGDTWARNESIFIHINTGSMAMKKSRIKVGGKYRARVSGNLVTVRVDEIEEKRFPDGFDFGGNPKPYNITIWYRVTNLDTGRKIWFHSGRFRGEVV